MEYKTKIEQLSNKLDINLQSLLYENSNYLPTITSTFKCIENSSEPFKRLLRHDLELEHNVKLKIGKALHFHYNLDKSLKPPYTKYFNYILISLLEEKSNNTFEELEEKSPYINHH